jgi:hypothetical protein
LTILKKISRICSPIYYSLWWNSGREKFREGKIQGGKNSGSEMLPLH